MEKLTFDKEAKVRMPVSVYRKLEEDALKTTESGSVGAVIRRAIHRYLRNKPAKPTRNGKGK